MTVLSYIFGSDKSGRRNERVCACVCDTWGRYDILPVLRGQTEHIANHLPAPRLALRVSRHRPSEIPSFISTKAFLLKESEFPSLPPQGVDSPVCLCLFISAILGAGCLHTADKDNQDCVYQSALPLHFYCILSTMSRVRSLFYHFDNYHLNRFYVIKLKASHSNK